MEDIIGQEIHPSDACFFWRFHSRDQMQFKERGIGDACVNGSTTLPVLAKPLEIIRVTKVVNKVHIAPHDSSACEGEEFQSFETLKIPPRGRKSKTDPRRDVIEYLGRRFQFTVRSTELRSPSGGSVFATIIKQISGIGPNSLTDKSYQKNRTCIHFLQMAGEEHDIRQVKRALINGRYSKQLRI